MKKVLIIVGSILVLIVALTTTIIVKRNQKINEFKSKLQMIYDGANYKMDSVCNSEIMRLDTFTHNPSKYYMFDFFEYAADRKIMEIQDQARFDVTILKIDVEAEGIDFGDVHKGILTPDPFVYREKHKAAFDKSNAVRKAEWDLHLENLYGKGWNN
jgi:uncharacterized protein YxeA